MKEAFWGLLIVLLGLFGVVVVNLFQNVTVDNDRVYYLIKESTEAAAYDAIDLTYYRVTGNIRMVEDKFVENLTRRFAQNVTIGDYKIIVEDLNELPPKISLRIRSGVTSLQGEEFGLLNRVDGIIEVKYNKDELEDFLCEGKTEEECTEIMNKFNTKVEIKESNGENQCKVDITNDEMDCIPGDIKFIEWGSHNLPSGICNDEEAPRNKERTAKYKTCDCGKWGEEKQERIIANPTKVGNEYIYTWTFKKETDVKVVDESVKGRVRIEVCTTSIGIKVPDNYKKLKPGVTSSNTYIDCPTGGVRIPEGTIMKVQGSYVPQNAVNREIIWTKSNNNIALKYDGTSYARLNPNMNTCELNSSNTNCMSINEVTAQDVEPKEVVNSNIIATNYRRRNQTAICSVTIWDGVPDTLGCKDKKIEYNETATMEITYTPENASKLGVTWSMPETEYATLDKTTGSVTGNNGLSPIDQKITVTIISTEDSTKTGTCTLTVKGKPCPAKYPYYSEQAAKDALTCKSSHHIKQVSNNGNGCYVAKCVCSGDYPYSSETAAKNAASCKSYQLPKANGDGNGCYKSGCKNNPQPSETTTVSGTCDAAYREQTKKPDCVKYETSAHSSCDPKSCRNEKFGTETVTSSYWCGYKKDGSKCGYEACSKCNHTTCSAATCSKYSGALWWKKCVKWDYSNCPYEGCNRCPAKSCPAAGAATCTVGKWGTGSVCGYLICRHCVKFERNYEDVNYSGKKETVTTTFCNNGVLTTTVRKYCIIKRSRFYANPGVEGRVLISTNKTTSTC